MQPTTPPGRPPRSWLAKRLHFVTVYFVQKIAPGVLANAVYSLLVFAALAVGGHLLRLAIFTPHPSSTQPVGGSTFSTTSPGRGSPRAGAAEPFSSREVVPNVLDRNLNDAEKILSDHRLSASVTFVDGAALGTIVLQEPEAGSVIGRGAVVKLWVVRGSPATERDRAPASLGRILTLPPSTAIAVRLDESVSQHCWSGAKTLAGHLVGTVQSERISLPVGSWVKIDVAAGCGGMSWGGARFTMRSIRASSGSDLGVRATSSVDGALRIDGRLVTGGAIVAWFVAVWVGYLLVGRIEDRDRHGCTGCIYGWCIPLTAAWCCKLVLTAVFTYVNLGTGEILYFSTP
jgi:PASTA domain